HRTVALAHRGSTAQHGVAVAEVRCRMRRDRGDLEIGGREGATVEALDVLEHVLHLAAGNGRAASREAIDHESVVRVRAVAEAQRLEGRGGRAHEACLLRLAFDCSHRNPRNASIPSPPRAEITNDPGNSTRNPAIASASRRSALLKIRSAWRG